jgi:tetratricopeptide (TPR) repeat protein
LFFVLAGASFYPVVLIRAIVRHTLTSTDRTLIDPRTLAWFIPLMLAGGWSFVDLMREGKVLRARRMAALREPPEQRWLRSLAAARAKGDQQAELVALSNVGFWLRAGDHYDAAMPYLEEALALARTLGDHPFEEERALYELGVGAFKRGDLDTAESLFRQCLVIVTTLEQRDEIANQYSHIGEFLCEYRGNREEGRPMLARAEAIYRELGQSHPRWRKDEQHMRDLRRQYGDDTA